MPKDTLTPVADYTYAGDALHEIDVAVQEAVERDPRMRLEYEATSMAFRVADLVRSLRQSAQLTQAGLAKQIGVSQPVIARLENPITEREPSLATLAKLARACDRKLVIELERTRTPFDVNVSRQGS
jgi:DNA-binding XRE family transcriptional regulator